MSAEAETQIEGGLNAAEWLVRKKDTGQPPEQTRQSCRLVPRAVVPLHRVSSL